MKERLKRLRKALGLTQRQFGERIGMKQNTVATWEMGRGEPSAHAVKYICRAFHVSERWLLTGEGDMLLSSGRSEEIADFVGRALADPEGFPCRVLLNLARLTPSQWETLERIASERV